MGVRSPAATSLALAPNSLPFRQRQPSTGASFSTAGSRAFSHGAFVLGGRELLAGF
jgi:hypothetical protein